MEEDTCRVLAALVDRYESTGSPVPVTALAATLGVDLDAVEQRQQRLIDCELAARAGAGYRPTVTGRELLDLDLGCGPIIVVIEENT